MLTQQDIYAVGSESRPPMLNKDTFVLWSSRLLCYVKSKPNGKLIYNSIMNGPYVRTFHEQTDDELTEKEVKQMEADDQAIQIILMGLSEDIYATVDSCETAQEIWLHVQQMMKDFDIGIQDKKAKLFNEWERFTSTNGELIESYNHFQNPGVQNVRNQNGLIVGPKIANPNENQIGNGNVVAARAEGDLNEIEEVNANCILMANLQQASTSGTQTDNTPVYDSYRSAEVLHNENCYNNEIFNMFSQEENVEQSGGTVDQNPATSEETSALYDSIYNNLAIEVEKVNMVNRKMKETVNLSTSLHTYENQREEREKEDEISRELERKRKRLITCT
ncbi:hypothetical protein Tco_0462404 [Tanacetum coccineum]